MIDDDRIMSDGYGYLVESPAGADSFHDRFMVFRNPVVLWPQCVAVPGNGRNTTRVQFYCPYHPAASRYLFSCEMDQISGVTPRRDPIRSRHTRRRRRACRGGHLALLCLALE